MIELICILAGFILGVGAVVVYTVSVWEINDRKDNRDKWNS